jgi:hypothetical protein
MLTMDDANGGHPGLRGDLTLHGIPLVVVTVALGRKGRSAPTGPAPAPGPD